MSSKADVAAMLEEHAPPRSEALERVVVAAATLFERRWRIEEQGASQTTLLLFARDACRLRDEFEKLDPRPPDDSSLARIVRLSIQFSYDCVGLFLYAGALQ